MSVNYKNAHILYVDDELNNLISFKATFRQHYTLHIAKSAEEGMDILRKHPIQAIVTDQRMPEVTGVQFLEQVIPEYPDTIRMILTGFSDVADIIKAINTGQVFRYITKPWDYHELKMTLDNALQMYALQKNNKNQLIDLRNTVIQQEWVIETFKPYVPTDIVEATLGTSQLSLV
jgi:adenylate cyclase